MVRKKQEGMSTTREQILNAVRANQPALKVLPEVVIPADSINLQAKFTETLTTIGGKVIKAGSYGDIIDYIKSINKAGDRVISSVAGLSDVILSGNTSPLPHSLQDVELAIIKAHFGVAENGAVWITEYLLSQRVLPFICQHLIVILNADDLVANMHQAYEKIGNEHYGYGTFIAGPSKTADIEQSLVLGAHGSRSMTIFLIKPPSD
ncbi:LUD domain-containing protein [Mucilaginibacter rigui]|uniref:LUD domain-containing protein n=2 Tax=Mucilaginibacter rigui TaxID=534635 RepID=A0ABR7X156_9SPHI|nr:LUD domain-containing protein [Mucilaginibacter rigui]